VAKLVERPAIEAERLAVAQPPCLEHVWAEPAHRRAENDRGALALLQAFSGLLAVLLRQPLLLRRVLVNAGLLRLLVHDEGVSDGVGHGEAPHAGLRLGVLEVPEAVVGLADRYDLALEVDVAPREAADLPATHPGADREEVRDVGLPGEVELRYELPDGLRLEGAAGLGVPARRVHLGAGVLGDDTVLHEVVEQQLERLVDLVEIGAAGGLAGKGVAGAHGGVHLLERLSRDLRGVGVANVTVDCLEESLVGHVGVLGELAGRTAPRHEVLRALLDGRARPLVHLVVLDLLDELAQGLLRLGVGAVEAPRAGLVLARAGVEPHGDSQLPLAALALGLVLLELDYGALARDLCHGYSPSPTTT